MARPNTQAQRREDIHQAAITLVGRSDLAQITIPEIAATLGVTANAVRYYYPDIETLIAELAQRSDKRFYHDRLALLEEHSDPAVRLEQLMSAGLPTGPEDAEWRVIWMAILDAGFNLQNRSDVQSIYHRQVGLYASVLADGEARGVFQLRQDAHEIAMTLMSMEDYLGYRIVARDPQISRNIALNLMRGYADSVTNLGAPAA
ncbi:TetR family transcriptional regulator [Leucobacter komagatae]|uniref:TetR family transcriptional regulator n=1 Tax=Leucobacter komagatae TaxID=55969 RepID=A0A542Y7Q7_9MICO|nr:TetR/AcrR family transcriptional regulator [Leucobacter komagatae]TQL44132.1 TetR family transcriptional regulator [Leucobacter komagatae]